MPIKFQCAACAAPIKAPTTHAGQTLPCPKCSQPVQVPAVAAAPPAPPVVPIAAAVETVGELPQIVVQDAPPVADDLPEFDDNAFAAPQTRSERFTSNELQPVRIVDIRMPFKSVLRFAFQFFLAIMIFSAILWLVALIFMLLLGAIIGTSFAT
ncbi:MAG: hypothetical protein ACR2NU_14720 [Aeoliella sp.]